MTDGYDAHRRAQGSRRVLAVVASWGARARPVRFPAGVVGSTTRSGTPWTP